MSEATYMAAAVQMHATVDKEANIAAAVRLVEEAAGRDARLVVLPEFFNCLGNMEEVVAQAEPIPGPTSRTMSELAARLRITLLAGSICEQSDQPGKGRNTSLLFGPDGKELAVYRKMHLFDADFPGQVTFTESDWIVPGGQIVCSATPLGTLGQATCYDLRFPELFRRLADRGMDVLAFPSAFAATTGRAHWEVLLRARAIENQVYVVAANQYGRHTPNFTTYGCSMIVDPWGQVLDRAAESGDAVVLAEIDRQRMAEVRRSLPSLKHRKL